MGKNLAMNISKPLDIDEIDYVIQPDNSTKCSSFFQIYGRFVEM